MPYDSNRDGRQRRVRAVRDCGLLLGMVVLAVLPSGCSRNPPVARKTPQRAAPTAQHPVEKPRSSTYRGAWFDVSYPGDFIARPSMRSSTKAEGFDSAFFTSPDKTVEFYVFSPQWNGKPTDIEMDPDTEISVSQSCETSGGTIVRRVTVKARDGSYLRSFVDTVRSESNTRLVFGIKYRTPPDYERYKPHYLRFKDSLVQYSD